MSGRLARILPERDKAPLCVESTQALLSTRRPISAERLIARRTLPSSVLARHSSPSAPKAFAPRPVIDLSSSFSTPTRHRPTKPCVDSTQRIPHSTRDLHNSIAKHPNSARTQHLPRRTCVDSTRQLFVTGTISNSRNQLPRTCPSRNPAVTCVGSTQPAPLPCRKTCRLDTAPVHRPAIKKARFRGLRRSFNSAASRLNRASH
ncbi:hypothetical protein F4827_006287 [Paraburkholderia bannensis]|uniref:Uncharacterized protein n=1 Tax=Paraburkholderia bannensis TaxID=765414 RepID=A0A7W9U3K5_9BURK|nr:hypothetical protein [Paraburkholderia sp. WP4_3_2]MBB6106412.1 hypothetical protein [Paraburkholderia bannensis]